ncbi:MAG: hypothetical protein K2X82_17905 [Gemmataceae bacterium]|nr:hypothetical protein [Gemmataceae bacterium]
MWWPFGRMPRRPSAGVAACALTRFGHCLRTVERGDRSPEAKSELITSIRQALEMMLGRAPTGDEVREVYDPDYVHPPFEPRHDPDLPF